MEKEGGRERERITALGYHASLNREKRQPILPVSRYLPTIEEPAENFQRDPLYFSSSNDLPPFSILSNFSLMILSSRRIENYPTSLQLCRINSFCFIHF